MLKRDEAIQALIRDGYDDAIVTELPKLFIADYFEKEEEIISEALDIFIDSVQRGDIAPDKYNNVNFANIKKMTVEDYKLGHCDGLFYNFKSHITEEFLTIVKRRPLRNILQNSGVLELNDGHQYYHKEIVGLPHEYYDLCRIFPYINYNSDSHYIKSGNLDELLLRKGFSEDSISIVFGEIGLAPMFQKDKPNDGIYINYDAIMALGNSKEYVPKVTPKN